MRRIGKKAKGEAVQFWGLGLIALLVLMVVWKSGAIDKFFVKPANIGDVPVGDNCGTAKTTTLTFSVQELENKTGVETFDTGYVFAGAGGNAVAGTDSTAGSVSLTCGETYTVKGISASGASGDSGVYSSVISGIASINADGSATFKATEPAQTLVLGGHAHGVLEARLFDVLNNGFAFDDAGSSATDYNTDGVGFNDTTSGDSGLTVGAGGEVHSKLYYRPSVDDNVFGDVGGYLILIDAGTTKWDVPTVKVDGVTLTDVKDSLNPDEKKAYSGYEYVYMVNNVIKRQSESNLDLDIFALSGVNPGTSDDISFDMASRGAYSSTVNANDVKVGAVKDDSSQTQVHNLENFKINIV